MMNPVDMVDCDQCHQSLPITAFPSESHVCSYCASQKRAPVVDLCCRPFAQLTLFGLTDAEKQTLLQYILMLQTLSQTLQRHERDFSAVAYRLSYGSSQQLIKVDVLYWLHHADKQGKRLERERDLLLKIREVACDWLNEMPPPPEQEYKLGTKERSQLQIDCVQRAVPLSQAQFVVLNALLSILADPNSVAVVHKFFPRGTLLRPDDLATIREHRELLQQAVHYSSYRYSLRQLDSLHFLGMDEALCERLPAWSHASKYHFPLVLNQFVLAHALQMPAATLIGPLTIVVDASLHVPSIASVAALQADCVDPTEHVEAELETMAAVMVNDLVRQTSHALYRWSKHNAANVLDKSVSLLPLPRLDVAMSLGADA